MVGDAHKTGEAGDAASSELDLQRREQLLENTKVLRAKGTTPRAAHLLYPVPRPLDLGMAVPEFRVDVIKIMCCMSLPHIYANVPTSLYFEIPFRIS